MSISRAFFASILLSLVVLHLSEAEQTVNRNLGAAGYPPPAATIDCGAACAARCRLSSRQKLCTRACGTRCARCNCVSPGTSGNHEVCPCYASLITHGGRRKCP